MWLAPAAGSPMDGVPLNVQIEAQLCCDLDLERLCNEVFTNCELACNVKASLVVQLRRLRSVLKIRPNGELNLVGQCSVEEARCALKRVAYKCSSAGFPVKFKKFRVRSVRWTEAFKPGFPIDILKLGQHHLAEIKQTSTTQALRVYFHIGKTLGAEDPQDSPVAAGADGSEENEGVSVQVSADGRVHFSGARSLEELERAMGIMMPILEESKMEIDSGMVMDSRRSAMPAAPRGRGRGAGRRTGPALSRASLLLAAPTR